MTDKITLIVRFKVEESAQAQFVSRLQEVFSDIEREETFVEASLLQDRDDPTSIVNYEVWHESPESFMQNQMTKEYRKAFEQAIIDLRVERAPSWYRSVAEWKKS
jgi:quinol monooxygenase YgiN